MTCVKCLRYGRRKRCMVEHITLPTNLKFSNNQSGIAEEASDNWTTSGYGCQQIGRQFVRVIRNGNDVTRKVSSLQFVRMEIAIDENDSTRFEQIGILFMNQESVWFIKRARKKEPIGLLSLRISEGRE